MRLESMRLAESFVSRQGEGGRTGNRSFFIRTSGCNLRCWFCDTPYASWRPEGETVTVDELVDRAVRAAAVDDATDVVLTGGEPLLWRSTEPLVRRIRDAGLHVTIETAGTIDRQVRPDLLSLSPKLFGSGPNATEHPRWADRHERRRLPIETMCRLIRRAVQTQVKFVLSDPDQWSEIAAIVARLPIDADQVWIMPEATTVEALDAAADWLPERCDESGYRFADRMHVRWYGNRRGT